MRVVTLDTETTGFNKNHGNGRKLGSICDGHRVVEIGCVEIVDNVITGREFHAYVNPERSMDPKATSVNGLTDFFLSDKPLFKDVAASFIKFIAGADLIVIHNALFDIAFIDQEFNLLDASLQPKQNFRVEDTLAFARSVFPGDANRLQDLCRRFSLSCEGLHGALQDARLLAQVYLNLIFFGI